LRGAITLLVVQALGLLALVGLVAYALSRENPAYLYSRTFLPFELFAIVWAVVLVALGTRLARRRAWARGPAVALELLFLPLGYFFVQRGAGLLGIPMIVLAVACVGLLITARSRAALGIH
jgi:hypothetical protein